MGPTWGRQDPCGAHVGPMNVAIWEVLKMRTVYKGFVSTKMSCVAEQRITSALCSYLSKLWKLLLIILSIYVWSLFYSLYFFRTITKLLDLKAHSVKIHVLYTVAVLGFDICSFLHMEQYSFHMSLDKMFALWQAKTLLMDSELLIHLKYINHTASYSVQGCE